MKRALLALVVSACGRISFDPVVTGGVPSDAKRDGSPGTGDGAVDAFNACSVAISVTSGVRSAQSTCQGRDLIDACGPASTQEVLFSFMPPTTKGYQIAAYNPGTSNVSNSTVGVAAGCTAVMGGCAGLLGMSLSAGTTYYFAVEASGGGCVNIEFLVQ